MDHGDLGSEPKETAEEKRKRWFGAILGVVIVGYVVGIQPELDHSWDIFTLMYDCIGAIPLAIIGGFFGILAANLVPRLAPPQNTKVKRLPVILILLHAARSFDGEGKRKPNAKGVPS